MIIAIDGYSSTGKSSLSKRIAKHLNLIHIDSGAMYRAVTLYAMQQGCYNEVLLEDCLESKLKEVKLHFKLNPDTQKNEIFLNGINVEPEIRTMSVSNKVSQVAEQPFVREFLVAQQQELGKNTSLVMDGRDIGTTVFPNADVKIFLQASAETRAKRRFLELKEDDDSLQLEQVMDNINRRDEIDVNRTVSPLIKAEDAIVVDNSALNLEQTIERVLEIIEKKQ